MKVKFALFFVFSSFLFFSCKNYDSHEWTSASGETVLSFDSDEWTLSQSGKPCFRGTYSVKKDSLSLNVEEQFSSLGWVTRIPPGEWSGKWTSRKRLELRADNGTLVLWKD